MTNLPPSDMPEPPAPITPGAMPPDPMAPAPPPPMVEPPIPVPPPPAAKPPSKMRAYITIGVIAVFLAIVLYAVRNNQDAGDLAVGTCFDVPTSADFSTVEKVECTAAHDAEVVFVTEYKDGDAYPIQSAIDDFLATNCFPAFESYVGEPFMTSEAFDMSYFKPTSDAWKDGERTFTCYVHDINGAKLTKSVKGAAAS